MVDSPYRYFFHCSTCRKDLEDETAYRAHLQMNHKADKYILAPQSHVRKPKK